MILNKKTTEACEDEVIINKKKSKFLILKLKKNVKEISGVMKKYNFKEDYPLLKKLAEIPLKIRLHETKIKNSPRLSVLNKEIDELNRISEAFNEALEDLPFQTIIHLQNIPHVLAQEKNVTELQHRAENFDIVELKYNLKTLQLILNYSVELRQKDRGGKKSNSNLKYAIFLLIAIYENGTGLMPKCGWSEDKNSHVGEFYNFVIELVPILKQLGIKLGQRKTIGKNSVNGINLYKKTLAHLKSDESFLKSLSTKLS